MKNKIIYPLFVILLIFSNSSINAQDLLDKLDKEYPKTTTYEIATFKTTRIGLGHSIETRKKGALQISLYNRYWDIPNFQSERFLADKVSTRYGLEYAFTDNFTFGFGYTNFDKISDGYFKYRLLRQSKGAKNNYLSVTLLQGISHRKTSNGNINLYGGNTSSNSYAFTSQVLLARKFSPELSVQISPTFLHRATTSKSNDPNSQFAIGFGGRQKITKHASIVSEYFYVANPLKSINTFNSFLVGVNWEVSDLMLQFHLTNARNYAEDTFITQTTHNFNFKDPNLHFGFNATYIIHTKKKKFK